MRWTDRFLVACAILVILAGPAMAVQELVRMLGEGEPDFGFRAAWRLPLGALALVAGALGLVALVRALREPVVRALSWRLVALLALGIVALAGAWWSDGALLSSAPHAWRAGVVAASYPLAGVLLAGSARRLAELHDHFGTAGRAAEFEL